MDGGKPRPYSYFSVIEKATARVGCKKCKVNFSKTRSEFCYLFRRNKMLVENVIPTASCVPLGTRPLDNIAYLRHAVDVCRFYFYQHRVPMGQKGTIIFENIFTFFTSHPTGHLTHRLDHFYQHFVPNGTATIRVSLQI